MKSDKIVALMGESHVYKQTFGEREMTTKVLPALFECNLEENATISRKIKSNDA